MKQIYDVSDKVGGFEVISVKSITDTNGILYEMIHKVSGSRLLFHSTSEKNKLFSVTFKTIPENDTGVFHILEHSVLLGSEKYPKRDPFQDLLKGSLNTFMNAMTFPEHTMYPISSRNEMDYMNLISVYLDAVFRPTIYKNEHAFLQEGWHYEYDEEGNVTANGVVYNEMKGVEASVVSRMTNEMQKMLYPDTNYRFVSGGKTEDIPHLTYSDFVKTHRRYYRPDNAIFYLEGNIDIEKPISLIEEYMTPCESLLDIPSFIKQEKKEPCVSEIEYPISDEEEENNKTNFLFGKILCDYNELEKIHAAILLGTFLTGSMAAPLSQSLIANELAQDVSVVVHNSIYQPNVYIAVNNSNKNCREDICSVINELSGMLCNRELLKAELEPLITNLEFHIKENEEPKALYNNINIMNTYLYGGNAEDYLNLSKIFVKLREYLDTDYYVELLKEILDVSTYSLVIAVPDKDKYRKEFEDEAERISVQWNSLTKEEMRDAEAIIEEFVSWQQNVSDEERNVKVPMIGLEDIEPKPEEKKCIEVSCDGIKVLVHPADISEMAYVNMYFPIPKSCSDLISEISLLTNIFMNVETTDSDVLTLQNKIRSCMGDLDFDIIPMTDKDNPSRCKVYLAVKGSFLKMTAIDAVNCIHEVIYKSSFANHEVLEDLLTSILEAFREKIIGNGNQIGLKRALSSWSSANAVLELVGGISCYEYLKNLCVEFSEKKDMFANSLSIAINEIFTTDKLTIGLTIPERDFENLDYLTEYGIHKLVDGIRNGSEKDIEISLSLPKEKVFIQIPAAVSYATAGINLKTMGIESDPAMQVAMKILSMNYLWNEIRVKGGAYGTGIRCSYLGNISFSTFRDPSPIESLDVLKNCASYLREFATSNETIDTYIIGTIADSEPLYGPRELSEMSDTEYLGNYTYDYFCWLRESILNTTKDNLLRVADIFDRISEEYVTCIVGMQKNNFKEDVTIIL